ncbi:uncharacterized protein LOC133182883 [Saccostrea echinata]|uniref:uncharacterized protein LOC133182883 n=1 Tax=Saccostrea echinata TaxID=191078 RepID=UPI002A7EC8D6|nr:uncharacterized protein LOC133182883 [Saccostrea echinata]
MDSSAKRMDASYRTSAGLLERMSSDPLVVPPPGLYDILPLSHFGDRMERYHRIMMAKTRKDIALMEMICSRRGIDLEKTVQRGRQAFAAHLDMSALISLKDGAVQELEDITLKPIITTKSQDLPFSVVATDSAIPETDIAEVEVGMMKTYFKDELDFIETPVTKSKPNKASD